ncbi:MAG: hypothetical protein K0R94_65 [Burkholderiales bacterium]|nr:hypothetical protein [Burkholderiales bacterium]
MDASTLLSQMKNVHQPAGISIFPIAIGWYILLILILVIICGLLWWRFIKNKYKKRKTQIYTLLSEIEKSGSNEMLSDVSILIKRVAIMKFPGVAVHTLFGEKWLEFLDRTGKTNNFTIGDGRYLLDIYQNRKIENPDGFFACVRQWLGTVL